MVTSQLIFHITSIVSSGASLSDTTSVGPFTIVEDNVDIGAETQLDSHVFVGWGTTIGSNCRIHKGAVVGSIPQDLKFEGEDSKLIVGDRTVIREYCTLNRGTKPGKAKTIVGSNCLLMAYSHVAHDCILGDGVILANAVNMAGHVEIDSYSAIGGMCAIHQFVKIGQCTFVGGLGRISRDVPPFILTSGEPLKYFGPNLVGLRRRGFTKVQVKAIKTAYGFIYSETLNLTQAVDAIKSEMEMGDEIEEIFIFLERSNRGLIGK